MSTSLVSKPKTLTQRLNDAHDQIVMFLRAGDSKRAVVAVLETALEEMRRNPEFAQEVRARHEALAPTKSSRASRNAKPPRKDLIPIKRIEGREFDMSAALDPYFLLELYGPHQLADALDRYPGASINEAVTAVRENNPGTKPVKRTKSAGIDYIVKMLTE